jgi:3-methyladenine DNA glycosylase/8-oxoguanine DNA glycosylase
LSRTRGAEPYFPAIHTGVRRSSVRHADVPVLADRRDDRRNSDGSCRGSSEPKARILGRAPVEVAVLYDPAVPHEHRLRIATPTPFSLDVVLRGHGWVALAPHDYDRDNDRHGGRLITSLDLACLPGQRKTAPVVAIEVREKVRERLDVRVIARRPLTRAALEQVRAALITSLAIDRPLDRFWQRCAATPRLRWVFERGAGRLMRSPTLFEELLKLLMTTNCAWSNTLSMVSRTTEALGRRDPTGRPAFPSAAVCAAESEQFWRDEIRVGYRASHCRTLAEGFASGSLSAQHFCDPSLSTDELRKRLLALPGFGPYAAGQALRLLGRFDDLALDSWVRKRAADLHGLPAGDDRAIASRYAEFEEFAGLALWMDVTAPWHLEGKQIQ